MIKSTHRAEVVKLELRKHPNADKLSVTSAFGYPVVVNTEQWANCTNNLACYVQPDTLVSINHPTFSFLAPQCKNPEGWYKIRAKKLRGVASFGLLVPVPNEAKEGDDLYEYFGLRHYEPEEKIAMGGDAIKGPEGFYPKYDVDSLRRYEKLFKDGEEVILTEKIHGCLQAETKVLMGDNSQQYICDIKVGDIVKSWNIDLQSLQDDIVTHIWENHDKDKWLTLTLDNGNSITCTHNHKFLTNNGWKQAKDLTESDDVVSI